MPHIYVAGVEAQRSRRFNSRRPAAMALNVAPPLGALIRIKCLIRACTVIQDYTVVKINSAVAVHHRVQNVTDERENVEV